MFHPRTTVPPPADLDALVEWIRARIRERHPLWRPTTAAARSLPVPVNLPGLDRAFAMVLAKYRNMPVDWRSEAIQDITGKWLLRPETPVTLAASAIRGVRSGVASSIEGAIAWRLKMEFRSRAYRAYAATRRDEAGLARYARYQRGRLGLRRPRPPVVRLEAYGPTPVRRVLTAAAPSSPP